MFLSSGRLRPKQADGAQERIGPPPEKTCKIKGLDIADHLAVYHSCVAKSIVGSSGGPISNPTTTTTGVRMSTINATACPSAAPAEAVTIWQPRRSTIAVMRANAQLIRRTNETDANMARFAFEPATSETEFTLERWRETSRAVQGALALLDVSKEELRAAIVDDAVGRQAALEELTSHAEFLDDVARLLRRAQARLQIVTNSVRLSSEAAASRRPLARTA
jgi:hypothetical protein